MVRDCIYEQLDSCKARTTPSIGEALEAFYHGNIDPHTAELAYHFYQAIPTAGPQRAITYSIQAAEWATSRLAYEDVPDTTDGHLRFSTKSLTSDRERANLLLDSERPNYARANGQLSRP